MTVEDAHLFLKGCCEPLTWVKAARLNEDQNALNPALLAFWRTHGR